MRRPAGNRTARTTLAAVVAVGIALTAGACSGDGSTTTTTVRKSTTTAKAAPTTSKAPVSKDFTIANLLTRDAQYATFEKVVKTAGANGELKGKGPVTLLAPSEAAFEALGAAETERLTSDKAAAAAFVDQQLLKGRLTFGDLFGKNGKTVTTVGGDKLAVVVKGTAVSVGGAPITKNDITASNGTIHVVSAAVQPA